MIETGIYNPITLCRSKDEIRKDVVLQVGIISWIFTDVTSVKLVRASDGVVVSTGTNYNFTYKGEAINSIRLQITLAITPTLYYVLINDTYYSDFYIQRNNCNLQIETKNSCINQYHDWETNNGFIYMHLVDAYFAKSEFVSEESIIITDKGQVRNTTSLTERHRVQFVAPIGIEKYINSLKVNDLTNFNTLEIKNVDVEVQEQNNGTHGLFTLSFEYVDKFVDAKGCCEVINIDNILNPEIPQGGEICALFSAEVINTTGTLSATLTSAPVGTPTYKWYRNGIFLSSAATLAVTTPGNYRVDVRVGVCSVSASYFLDNPCNLFELTLTNVNNEINGTVSNVPSGEVVSYSVVKDGIEVATALPYTALANGIYYVYATAGDCEKVKGIFVNLVNSDCDYTLSITDNGTELEAVTTALTPTYSWEFEDGNDRTVIGATATIQVNAKGIYWLTITQGGCSKTVYLYKEPLAETGVFLRTGGTGTTFSIIGINLLNITNFAAEIKVTVNGVVFSYVAGTPTIPNTYGVNVSGQVLVPFSLTNPTIIVELI